MKDIYMMKYFMMLQICLLHLQSWLLFGTQMMKKRTCVLTLQAIQVKFFTQNHTDLYDVDFCILLQRASLDIMNYSNQGTNTCLWVARNLLHSSSRAVAARNSENPPLGPSFIFDSTCTSFKIKSALSALLSSSIGYQYAESWGT